MTTANTVPRTIIRELRSSAGMTRLDLSLASGVSTTYLQTLEAGKFPLRRRTPGMVAVCEALGVTEEQVRGEAGGTR